MDKETISFIYPLQDKLLPKTTCLKVFIMIHGLLWLPLLAAFIGLAWQGSKEYRKVESYRTWALQFEKAKYDIYAVLGQKGDNITWGKPTPTGPVNLETFSLKTLTNIRLMIDDKPVDMENTPEKGRTIELEFVFPATSSVRIPFTEIPLAAQWGKYLQSLKIQSR